MSQIDWDSTRVWGIIGVSAALVISLLGILISPFVNREWPTRFSAFFARNQLMAALFGVVMSLMIWAIANTSIAAWAGAVAALIVLAGKLVRDKNTTAKQLAVAETRLADAENQLVSLGTSSMELAEVKFRRFEKIETIVYGHIAYSPLLYHDETGQPHGVGTKLLEMIFHGKKIEALDSKALWSDFVDDLSSGKYDIIATPIFETRERSTRIAFCSPMFYSDVGMYVKRTHILGRQGSASWSFEEAIATVKKMNLQVLAIDGEISGKMAMKYLGLTREEEGKWLNPNKDLVTSLIRAINRDKCEVAFAEVFQAEQSEPVKNRDVINILRPKALLYPVSFAVRKEDYVLRRYINSKLLEIEETLSDGVLTVVFSELQRHEPYKHYTLEDVKRYFVRDYPEPGIKHDLGQTSAPPEEPPSGHNESQGARLQRLFEPEKEASSRRQLNRTGISIVADAFAEG